MHFTICGTGMERFRVDDILEQDLPEVADFLVNVPRENPSTSAVERIPDTVESLLPRLRWRLAENPMRSADSKFGQCLRTQTDEIAGVCLQFPSAFRLGDDRLVGLCGGSFFVSAMARLQGLFMMLRFMKAPGADFAFSTTCNETSATLWDKLGGRPVPDSQFEYLLPIRYGPLAEEVVLRKTSSVTFANLAALPLKLVAPLLTPGHKKALAAVRPCEQWDTLASLAEQNRNPDVLTCDRSSDYLRWRFQLSPERDQTRIFCFENEAGDEGWFALRRSLRGMRRQIHTETVIDLVIPKSGIQIEAFLGTLLELRNRQTDTIVLQGRRKTWTAPGATKLRTRSFNCPHVYCSGVSANKMPLADLIELVPAMGDTSD